MKKTVYVGMALTGSPEEYHNAFQHELKDALRAIDGIEVIDFIEPGQDTDEAIVAHDKKCVEESDLMIGMCDHPATGLGMEIVFRHNTGKPLLLFSHKDAKVTHMVVGFAKREDIPCIRYKTVDDIIDHVSKFLTEAFIQERSG